MDLVIVEQSRLFDCCVIMVGATIRTPTNEFYICMYVYIYIYIILPVVLYGCETWSLTLREERKLRVFENMV